MFGRKRPLSDFSAELEAHLVLEIDRLREQGLSEDDAGAQARLTNRAPTSTPQSCAVPV